ncbi:NifU family protein [Patescibacteria group bacterium]|nr:NifU family protein [Patescibacteria group bacterium]
MRERIEKILEEKVRPFLAMEGGNVELVEVTEDNVVKVKLTGACRGCPMAQLTLKSLVENTIKSHVPQVQRVEAV